MASAIERPYKATEKMSSVVAAPATTEAMDISSSSKQILSPQEPEIINRI